MTHRLKEENPAREQEKTMSLNVLIVDDSAIIRKMIIKTLGLSGLPLGEIHEAANGQEGLDKLEDQWVDLVFADLNMPVMDGETMIDELRKTDAWSDLAVIVVSTEGSETRIERLKEKGVEFIHKPFTPEQIRNVANNMLGLSHERTAV
jgi:two-component system, chemotaxis family, chemotaxis protein CheY